MECQTLNQSHPTTWFDDELILHHHSPFYFIPDEQRSPNPIAHLLLSNLHSNYPPRGSLFERGVSRIDVNKYTLKLKCCENGMADDGYKWRKYGQKSIKNSPYPRSYYRCTNRKCSAKKQVERSKDDEDETLIITYEGLHLHFAYPYFPLGNDVATAVGDHPSPPPKRLKTTASPEETEQQSRLETEREVVVNGASCQGLLEDVVPLVIRNPAARDSSNCTCSNSSSYRSSPVASSSSSLSWSPMDSTMNSDR
ncbi:Probable WRKY transcription factor 49 [Linum perenne]